MMSKILLGQLNFIFKIIILKMAFPQNFQNSGGENRPDIPDASSTIRRPTVFQMHRQEIDEVDSDESDYARSITPGKKKKSSIFSNFFKLCPANSQFEKFFQKNLFSHIFNRFFVYFFCRVSNGGPVHHKFAVDGTTRFST